jgi:hydroxyacylglutathione hydrolase
VTSRVERLVVPGRIGVDGDTCAHDTNVWCCGDERECAVIDPTGDVSALLELAGATPVKAILVTHAHDAHISAAVGLAEATGGLIFLHQDDFPLWVVQYPSRRPDVNVVDGLSLVMGGVRLRALHTPGHTPGGVCWYAPDLGVVFTGDTLGPGRPGGVDHADSDYDSLQSSIRKSLFTLPTDTVVHPGHGEDTRIGSVRWDPTFWGSTGRWRHDAGR